MSKRFTQQPILKAFCNISKKWIHPSEFYVKPSGAVWCYPNFDGDSWAYDAVLCRSTELRDCKRTKEFPEGEMIFEHDVVVFWFDEKLGYAGLNDNISKYTKMVDKVFFVNGCFYFVNIQSGDVAYAFRHNNYCIRLGSSLDNTDLLKEPQ